MIMPKSGLVWLDVIGIGEDGAAGLGNDALEALRSADVIIGGDRHHRLMPDLQGERVAWPSPFKHSIERILSYRGRRVAILVTGDPLWYSAGALLQRHIAPDEIRYHPQLSAFQWAAARMGWSLADIETLTVHGRDAEQIVPYIAPGIRMLILTRDGDSPREVAKLLKDRGYSESTMTVLAALGGPKEKRLEGVARTWRRKAPNFHTLAVECIASADAELLPRTGLPDDAFVHDGKMTKRVVRALALAKLVPVRGQVLWDIGCGCGSIAIEWMRGAPEAIAYGLEPLAKRRNMAAENARKLGVPKLKLVDAQAPEGLADLPDPDAVFIGGGISLKAIETSLARLREPGRLVAHAVTLESAQVLEAAFARHGGELMRIGVETAEPVGPWHGYKPSMTVLQWSLEKRGQSGKAGKGKTGKTKASTGKRR